MEHTKIMRRKYNDEMPRRKIDDWEKVQMKGKGGVREYTADLVYGVGVG